MIRNEAERVLAIGCFHGKWPTGLTRYVEREDIDAVLALGDFPGERLRPYFREHAAKLKPDKYGHINFSDLAPFVGKKRLQTLKRRDATDGIRVLQRLDSLGAPVYAIHGNHDHSRYNPFTERDPHYYLERLVRPLQQVAFVDYDTIIVGGYDISLFGAKYPNFVKNESRAAHQRKKSIRAEERRELLRMLREPSRTIVATHQPPYRTRLDRVNDRRNPGYGKHFGDDVLRSVIERKQPALVLCAHFHENQGIDKIGKKRIVCTGYGAKGQAALVELKKRPVVKLVKIR